MDKTRAGIYTKAAVEGGPIILPPQGLSPAELELQVLFDHSLFEVFALGGRALVASRVYPEDIADPQWELGLFGTAGRGASVEASAEVWEMQDCWLEGSEAPSKPPFWRHL